jgi:hypothetical protein
MSGMTGRKDLESMMRELGLREEDLSDVVFEEEQSPAGVENCWMVVVSHTDR